MVSSHLVLCYATALVNTCCAPNSASPYLFQRPIFRLPAAGHSWVAIFFLLLGFVNSLKPIKLSRSGQADLAAASLAHGAFCRICRLMLPAAAATILSWTICQLKLYETARSSDAFWLRDTSPTPSPDAWAAVRDLKNALRDTWLLGRGNYYDQPQWAMIHLLQGSTMVMMALVITVNMRPRWRTLSLLLLSVWSLDWSRELRDRGSRATTLTVALLTLTIAWVGATCFMGIALAELSLSPLPGFLAPYSRLLSPPFAVLGLMLMSYTKHSPEAQPWSKALFAVGNRYLPVDTGEESLDRTYGGMGAILLLTSIIISPHARHILSLEPLKWLGKVSFAVYLLHGMVLRTVFAWVLFFGQDLQEFMEQGTDGFVYSEWRYVVPGSLRCAFATVVSLAVILVASHLWSVKVEPAIARITRLLENTVTGRGETEKRVEGNRSLLPVARA